MSPFRFILTDVSRNHWVSDWSLDSETLPLKTSQPWKIRKTRLHGGLQDGVDLIEVDNGVFSFSVIPTRGMGIGRGSYRGHALGWDSPVRDLVHPAFVELNDRGGLGWLKGFNEWIVRCGLSSNGAPGTDVVIDNNGNEAQVFLPLHGKIANTPARFVEVQIQQEPPFQITVRGVVEESMLFGPALRLTSEISTELGSNALHLSDQVTNLNSTPEELELLYHCNYGPPFLEQDAAVLAPTRTLSPRDARAQEDLTTYDRFRAPTEGYVEQVYFYELLGSPQTQQTQVLLKNASGSLGTSLHFSLEQMPCFSLWKNTASQENGYVTGLEPGTNYPNPKRFEREQGRVVVLQGGETRNYALTLAVHEGRDAVRELERQIEALQRSAEAQVLLAPDTRFSAAG
jgi:hypothetical protein